MAEELRFSAALLLAGEAPCAAQVAAFLPYSLQQQLRWVAADGGCQLAQSYQVQLQAIVGDFDSGSTNSNPIFRAKQQLNNRQELHFPTDKDESDRNLALEYLIRQGHRNIVQIGGGGGRSDHFLAMIYDYQLQRCSILPKLWLTRYEAIFYLEAGEKLEFTWPKLASPTPPKLEPALVSVFPLSEQNRLYSEQLKWPLAEKNIGVAQGVAGQLPYSLSNWAVGQTAIIGVERGRALVFCPHPAALMLAAQDCIESPLIFRIYKTNP